MAYIGARARRSHPAGRGGAGEDRRTDVHGRAPAASRLAMAAAPGRQPRRAEEPPVAAARPALAGPTRRRGRARRGGRRQLARGQRPWRGGGGAQPGRHARPGDRQAESRRAGARGARPCGCRRRGRRAQRSRPGRLSSLQSDRGRQSRRLLAAPRRRPAELRLPHPQRRSARGRGDSAAGGCVCPNWRDPAPSNASPSQRGCP